MSEFAILHNFVFNTRIKIKSLSFYYRQMLPVLCKLKLSSFIVSLVLLIELSELLT